MIFRVTTRGESRGGELKTEKAGTTERPHEKLSVCNLTADIKSEINNVKTYYASGGREKDTMRDWVFLKRETCNCTGLG